MEQVILQFNNELENQFKSKLDNHIWAITLKIHTLFSAMEKTRYKDQLQSIGTRDTLITSASETKIKMLQLMKELETIVPELNGVLLDEELQNIDEQDLFKIIITFNRFGLKRDDYKNQDSVVAFFKGLIEEYLTSKKIVDITPKELIQLMIEAIEPTNGTAYDGTAGIGNIMEGAYHYAKRNNGEVKVFGQELDEELYKIGKLNLFVHGIIPENGDLLLGDTIRDPKWLDGDQIKQFDYVLMNFSFGVRDWGHDKAKEDKYGRFDLYGVPSKAQGDYAFIIHALSSLNSNGKAALIVPFGTLIRGGGERKTRSILLKDDVIESIVALPDNLFTGTGIQVALLILNKNKSAEKRGKVQLINAENDYGRTRTLKFLEEKHIAKIVHALEVYENEERYSKIVSIDEIEENQYDLNPSLYFENIELKTEFGKVEFNRKEYEKSENLVKISDIADVVRGVNLPGKRQMESGEGDVYPVIQIRDIENGEILFDRIEKFPIKARDIDRVTAKPGDILVASRGTQQKIAIVADIQETILVSSMFVIIRITTDDVAPEYVKRILESPIGQYYFEANQSGSIVTVLTPNDIKAIEIPLLDKEQQIKFVNKLNQADEIVKKAEEERRKIYLSAYYNISTAAKSSIFVNLQ
ncbi:N-6 DNA methylase [Caldifermentibacillus hisashii]|uniref:N-6 DNA methylase n=1 Tax=Caldifermentibacillus hisashii TaxID=996558 RepID=UPI003D1C68D2